MRILFWTELFWPNIGGIEVLASRYAVAVRARGHEVLVVTAAVAGLPAVDRYQDIPVHRFPFWDVLNDRDLEAIASVRAGLLRLHREFHPELVHATALGPSIVFERGIRRSREIPLLVTMQQTGIPESRHTTAGTLANGLRAANWVACCSESQRAQALRMAPEIAGRTSVIPNAAQPLDAPPTALPFDPPTLLCLGRLSPEKGIDLALRAFALLAPLHPELRLVLAGDGPGRAELEGLAESLGVMPRVEFTGWIHPQDVANVLNRATLVLMPSRREGMPVAALEAASMGRPVVAARVGGLPELVVHGETGVLIPAEDPAALASEVASLLARPDRVRELGEASQRRAANHFGWDRYVESYEALYGKLTKEMAHVG